MIRYILLSGMLLLASCATAPITVDTVNHDMPTFSPDRPMGVSVRPVYWHVFNNEAIQELAKKNDPNAVYFVLDSDNFTSNLLNFSDTLRFIEQQNANLDYFNGLDKSQSTTQPK